MSTSSGMLWLYSMCTESGNCYRTSDLS